ncbi:MAG: hypothetical protein IJF07_03970 [Lachnospiraceae bacterium]|nr:hypothetical protein [Lachnospiraceae bacterium]
MAVGAGSIKRASRLNTETVSGKKVSKAGKQENREQSMEGAAEAVRLEETTTKKEAVTSDVANVEKKSGKTTTRKTVTKKAATEKTSENVTEKTVEKKNTAEKATEKKNVAKKAVAKKTAVGKIVEDKPIQELSDKRKEKEVTANKVCHLTEELPIYLL